VRFKVESFVEEAESVLRVEGERFVAIVHARSITVDSLGYGTIKNGNRFSKFF
jgi:hypothetical protein